MIPTYDSIGLQVKGVREKSISELAKAALKVLSNKPLFDIETSSGCNIACSFCPRTSMRRQTKIMSPKTFELVLKMLPDNATVMFAGLGEPLLNKDLELYVSKLKARSISPCIITNGVLLTVNRQQTLIAAGIDQIQISYSWTTDNSLKLVMGTTKYKEIIDANLRNLSAIKPDHLRVQLNFVLMEENQDELPEVMKLAESWGFEVHVRRVHNRGGHYDINKDGNNIKSSCGIFAAVTFITVDGNVLACSNDVKEESSFNHVSETTWEEIFTWKKKTLLQELQFEPCSSCSDDYRWLILDYLSVDKRS